MQSILKWYDDKNKELGQLIDKATAAKILNVGRSAVTKRTKNGTLTVHKDPEGKEMLSLNEIAKLSAIINSKNKSNNWNLKNIL